MKFTVNRKKMSDMLGLLAPIANRRSPLPILSNVLIDARDSTVTLTSTNLEIGSKAVIEADVTAPGTTTIPMSKILEIVRSLDGDTVMFELKDHFKNHITSGKSAFNISGLDPSDYPVFTEDVGEPVEIESAKLKAILEDVMFCGSNDDSRFNLNGICFSPDGECVATDGHRLAKHSIDIPILSGCIVPKDGCAYLLKTLLTDTVSISISKKNIFARSSLITTSIRLVEGDYPDYKRVIPENPTTTLQVDTQKLSDVVKRISLLTSDRNRGGNLVVKDGNMELSANHPDMGEATDNLDITQEGEGFELIINVAYLLDTLAHIKSPTCNIEYFGDGKPIVFKRPNDNEYMTLIMPMRK